MGKDNVSECTNLSPEHATGSPAEASQKQRSKFLTSLQISEKASIHYVNIAGVQKGLEVMTTPN